MANARSNDKLRPSGEVNVYLDVDGNPTNTPPAPAPHVTPHLDPSTFAPDPGTVHVVDPVAAPPIYSPPQQPPAPSTWISGVPNWLTLVVGVGVGVAGYRMATSSRENPTRRRR